MSVNLDLSELLSDYPSIHALAFDASGKRLAVGGALSVLVYAVEGTCKLRLLETIEVNDEEDMAGGDGHAIVEKVAFSSDAKALYVALSPHSGSFGFSAERSFDIESGERLSCSRLGGPRFPWSELAGDTERGSQEPPEGIEAERAQRLWSSPDGTTEIWTDDSGVVLRRQRLDGTADGAEGDDSEEEPGEKPGESIDELLPPMDPGNDLAVAVVTRDGRLCARALNDFNEGLPTLEVFAIAQATEARRRRTPLKSARRAPRLSKAAQAQQDKLRRLIDAASPPEPPELLLMLAEATLAHGKPGHKTAASLLERWDKEHAGARELAAPWRARAEALRQSLRGSARSGAAPEPRSAAGGSEADWSYARAWANGATGHEREALEQLLEILGSSPAPQKERARRTMVALFEQLGPQEDLCREYRGRLQIYL